MSRFVQASDFESGKLKISTTIYSSGDLQTVIDDVEKTALQSLLGCELYDLFVAAWDAKPTPPLPVIYQKIYDSFCEVGESECCNSQVISKGMKDMLMNLIYFEFVRNQQFQNRTTGTKKTEQENSSNVFPNDFGLFTIYNFGINTYQAIQWYINAHIIDYPTYKGQCKELMSWI